MFKPEVGETIMSMRCRIWELQQMRATFGTDGYSIRDHTGEAIARHCDRRIKEIQEEIEKLERTK